MRTPQGDGTRRLPSNVVRRAITLVVILVLLSRLPAFAAHNAGMVSFGSASLGHQVPAAPAERWYQLAVDLDPTLAKPYWWLGQMARARDDSVGALPHWSRVSSAGSRLLAQCVLEWKTGQPRSQVEDCLRAVLELSPNMAAAYFWAGHVSSELGDYDRAIDLLERGRELAPDDCQLAAKLAKAYWQRGDHERAMEVAVQASRLPEVSEEPYLIMAEYATRVQKDERAGRQYYERAIQINAQSEVAWAGLGSIALEQGDYSSAADAYYRVLRSNPGNASAYRALGLALRNLGYFDDADAAFGAASRLSTRFSERGGVGEALNGVP